MNRAGMAFVVGAFFCMSAAAQPQTGAQAGAQSSSQASVQAGQTQAQASGNASVSTSASAQNGQVNSSLAAGTAFNADRKSTRLNSSHSQISYAVFCLQKKTR